MQHVQGVVGNLDDQAALLAHEVVMGVVGEVVDGRSVSEVDMVDHPETLELVQEAVDGGFMHVGLVDLDVGGEFFGRRVAVVVHQRLQDRPSGAGDSTPVGPEEGEDAF